MPTDYVIPALVSPRVGNVYPTRVRRVLLLCADFFLQNAYSLLVRKMIVEWDYVRRNT